MGHYCVTLGTLLLCTFGGQYCVTLGTLLLCTLGSILCHIGVIIVSQWGQYCAYLGVNIVHIFSYLFNVYKMEKIDLKLCQNSNSNNS